MENQQSKKEYLQGLFETVSNPIWVSVTTSAQRKGFYKFTIDIQNKILEEFRASDNKEEKDALWEQLQTISGVIAIQKFSMTKKK